MYKKIFNKILIVGYGVAGKFLKEFCEQGNIFYEIYDDRIEEFNNKNSINWLTIEGVFISPGIPKYNSNRHHIFEEIEKYNLRVISDYDILYAFNPNAIYIGVTGTAGKTTTTHLVSYILEKSGIKNTLCGNMGENIFVKSDVYVMEMGAHQLYSTQNICFDIVGITNISPDHITEFEDYSIYRAAKLSILRKSFRKTQSFFSSENIFPRSSDYIPNVVNLSEKYPFLENYVEEIRKEILKENNIDLSTRSDSFILNANLSCSMVEKMNIPKLQSRKFLESFEIPKFRQEQIGIFKGVKIINDSKSTNIIAGNSAIRDKKCLWIAGGRLKNKDLTGLDLSSVCKCLFFGQDRGVFEKYAEFLL